MSFAPRSGAEAVEIDEAEDSSMNASSENTTKMVPLVDEQVREEEEEDDIEETCAICWDDLDPAEARLTPCGHVFCTGCLDKLLLAADTVGPSGVLGFADGRCPMCRTYVQHSDLMPLSVVKGSSGSQKKSKRSSRAKDKKGAASSSGSRGKTKREKKVQKKKARKGRREALATVDEIDANDREDVSLLAAAAEEGSFSLEETDEYSYSSGAESSKDSKDSEPLAVVDVIDAVVKGGKGAGVRVAAAAQWPSALPFITKDPANSHAITAPVPKAWIAIEFGQALRIQPQYFTLCRTSHTDPPRKFLVQGSTRPNIVHDVDPQSLGLDDSDWFPLGSYEASAADWGLPGTASSECVSHEWQIQTRPLRWCTAVRVVMDGPNFAGTQELSVCDFRVFGLVKEHSSDAQRVSAQVQSQRLRTHVMQQRREQAVMEVQGNSRHQLIVRMLFRILSCICTIVVTFSVVMFLGAAR